MKRVSIALSHLIIVVLLGVLVLAVPTTQAQSGGIGGKPANPDPSNERTKSIFVKQLAPGQTSNDAVEVINSTDSTKVISVYSVDSVASSDGAFACAQAGDKKVGVGGWIRLSQSSVRLNARESTKVPFTISPPSGISVGEHNGCIVLQEQKEATVQGGISLSFRTAIRVAVLVPGEVRKNLQPTGITAKTAGQQLIVTPSAKNTGNVSLDTAVNTTIKTVFGTTVSRQDNTFPVLRDQLSQWNFEFKKPFWGGLYKASYSLTYDEAKGAHLRSYRQAPKTVNGPSKVIFITPHPAALVIELLIVTLLGGTFYAFKYRRRSRHTVAKHWQDYVVKPGDDVQSIASQFKISWKLLAKSNSLAAPYQLKPGDTIKVPAQKTTTSNSKHPANMK